MLLNVELERMVEEEAEAEAEAKEVGTGAGDDGGPRQSVEFDSELLAKEFEL